MPSAWPSTRHHRGDVRHRRPPLLLALPPHLGRASRPSRAGSRTFRTRVKAELVEVGGQRKLLQWTVPGLAHAFTFWGFTILMLTILEAYGGLFAARLPHPPHRARPRSSGSSRTSSPWPCSSPSCVFTGIRVKHSPKRENRRSRFFGSHTGAAWLVLAHDLRGHGHPARLPGRPGQHRQLPLRLVGVRLPRPGQAPRTARAPASTASSRRCSSSPTSPSSSASWSSSPTRSTSTSSWPPSTWPPRAGPGPSARSPPPRTCTWRTSARTTGCSGPATSRTSPGSSSSTWPPAPSAGAASRSARPGTPASPSPRSCSSWTCATTSSPRAGPGAWPKNRAGRRARSTTLVPTVIDPDVLWSCTTCGACVEECPVDIEHVDTIVDMRRYEVLMESAFPTEAGLMLRNIENQGDPWGLGSRQAHRLDRRARLRGPGDHRRPSPTTSSTSTGWAAPAPSTSGPARAPRPRPACCTGPASPSASSGRGSPAPATRPAGSATSTSTRSRPRPTSRPSTSVGRQEGHRLLPALLQLAVQRVPVARRRTSRSSTTPSCSTIWCRTGKLTPGGGYTGTVTYHDPCYLGPPQPGLRRAPLGHRRHPRRRRRSR